MVQIYIQTNLLRLFLLKVGLYSKTDQIKQKNFCNQDILFKKNTNQENYHKLQKNVSLNNFQSKTQNFFNQLIIIHY